jgi:hypothetical protein
VRGPRVRGVPPGRVRGDTVSARDPRDTFECGEWFTLDPYERGITVTALRQFIALTGIESEGCACEGHAACPDCHGRRELADRARILLGRITGGAR